MRITLEDRDGYLTYGVVLETGEDGIVVGIENVCPLGPHPENSPPIESLAVPLDAPSAKVLADAIYTWLDTRVSQDQ